MTQQHKWLLNWDHQKTNSDHWRERKRERERKRKKERKRKREERERGIGEIRYDNTLNT